MRFHNEISEAFQKNALEYFGKDFEKHKNYLLKVAFGRNSAMIPKKAFDDAIIIWGIDSKRCVKELLKVLLPLIEKTMEIIHGRALKLLDRYNSATLSVEDRGRAGNIQVQSERGAKR